ncbi:zinc finger protein 239-like [Hemiscyllium ocellatum]|uniref:zinc finger protein 239-like n=1 Tax=Hemiscyllium ocellatum TaxID=170820 RepID=UPI0029668637|nr:zinc finger protein 239-like [Hemiscyllium ocellatum]
MVTSPGLDGMHRRVLKAMVYACGKASMELLGEVLREKAQCTTMPQREWFLGKADKGGEGDGNHTGGKQFNCSESGKGVAQFSNLLTHQWVHTDKKPFNGPEYEKGIKRAHELLYHQRVHADEKPFKCILRGNTFRPSFDLSLHLRTQWREAVRLF